MTADGEFRLIPLALVDLGTQGRRCFPEAAHAELTASVRELGVQSPILLRPRGERFGVVYGERRVRAARAAALEEIPALVREMSDKEVTRRRLAENLQREDLNALERAWEVCEFKESNRYTWDQVSKELHSSVTYLMTLAGLRRLPEEDQITLFECNVTTRMALLIKRANPEPRAALLARIREGEVSYAEAEELVDGWQEAAEYRTRTIVTDGNPEKRAAEIAQTFELVERIAHELSNEERRQLRALIQTPRKNGKGRSNLNGTAGATGTEATPPTDPSN